MKMAKKRKYRIKNTPVYLTVEASQRNKCLKAVHDLANLSTRNSRIPLMTVNAPLAITFRPTTSKVISNSEKVTKVASSLL